MNWEKHESRTTDALVGYGAFLSINTYGTCLLSGRLWGRLVKEDTERIRVDVFTNPGGQLGLKFSEDGAFQFGGTAKTSNRLSIVRVLAKMGYDRSVARRFAPSFPEPGDNSVDVIFDLSEFCTADPEGA